MVSRRPQDGQGGVLGGFMASGTPRGKISEMPQIRHSCHARLFDTHLPIKQVERQADLSIKCPRCSREQKKIVLARYCFLLPRWIIAVESPKPILCINTLCLARVVDISLPLERVYHGEQFIDLSIACSNCKTVNNFRLGGLAETVIAK